MDVRFEIDPALDCIQVVVRAPERDDEVEALLEKLSAPSNDRITVFDDTGVVRSIPADELVIASVLGKHVNVITEDGSWLTRRTLQSLEDVLDPRHFVRISRYELVNLDKVVRFDFTVAGKLRLELVDGMETWASRRCIPAINQRLKEGRG